MGLQTCCNKKKKKGCYALGHFYLNKKKRPKSSKSSICFQFGLLFKNVFLFSLFQVFLKVHELLLASEVSVSLSGVSQ